MIKYLHRLNIRNKTSRIMLGIHIWKDRGRLQPWGASSAERLTRWKKSWISWPMEWWDKVFYLSHTVYGMFYVRVTKIAPFLRICLFIGIHNPSHCGSEHRTGYVTFVSHWDHLSWVNAQHAVLSSAALLFSFELEINWTLLLCKIILSSLKSKSLKVP